LGLSRRNVLAGIAAAPALTAAATPTAAQTATASAQAKAALKDAKGTKLVMLGTAAGPVPGRTRKMISHVIIANGAAYVLDCGKPADVIPRRPSRGFDAIDHCARSCGRGFKAGASPIVRRQLRQDIARMAHPSRGRVAENRSARFQ
jgi:hypothetical protein